MSIPGIPSIPELVSIPGIPSLPGVVSIPGIPSLPGVPSVWGVVFGQVRNVPCPRSFAERTLELSAGREVR
ncbi:hypothetical protein ASE41_27375 [Streptomyces sp. Root264]|nr:hypothetical protein ASE41_27375 [Streptomyces sp. Root264]